MNFWYCAEAYQAVKKALLIVFSILALVIFVAVLSFEGGAYECEQKAQKSQSHTYLFDSGVCSREMKSRSGAN
jgi:hypothetical protein